MGGALLAVALWILHRELRAYHYRDLLHAVRGLPPARVLLALALTALNYVVLTGYDALGLRYVGHVLPYRRVALAASTGYAVSNSLGLPLLTAAPLRYRLYSRWGVPGLDIARLVAFYTATFWLGLLAVGGIAFLLDPLASPVPLPAPVGTLRPVGVLLLLLLAAYLGVNVAGRRTLSLRGFTLTLPGPRLAAAQVVLSAVDWMLGAAVLYVLLPAGTLSYPAFLGVYMLAQSAGILSHVPGGLGIFESVMLLALTPGLAAPDVLGILLAFRVVYYLIPLALAGTGLALYEGFRLRGRLAPATAPLAEWTGTVVPHAMAGLLFLGGVVLLVSGATPASHSRLAWLTRVLPLAVVELSHLLASAVGVGLLLLARGLQLRLNSALHLALLLLAGGVVLSLAKGLDYEEAAALSLVLAVLWLSRREFYRPAALLEDRFTPGWIAAVALVLGAAAWLGFFAYKHVEYSGALWWRFGPGADAPRFLRAMVGAAVVAGGVGLTRLLRPARAVAVPPAEAELDRAAAVIAAQGRADANLALLGDKTLLFSRSGAGFLMYGAAGRSLIAMGDPAGPAAEQGELAWTFRELCDAQAAWPVFYQITPAMIPVCLDMGLTLSKLGEEARVPLAEFTLEGRGRKDLRKTLRHVEQAGGRFELVPPGEVAPLIPALRAVSDDWLARKRAAEKGFSLGRFAPDYLRRFPLALVRHQDRIVAFANLWTAAPGTELSVDLMRFTADAPHGVMDYLFTRMLLWGREQGYRWFTLGVAPLAGMEGRRHTPLWNRVGRMLFRHGEYFYNFRGLRQYKEKFDPVWEPRYLASPGGLTLPFVLTSVSTLVAGGMRGVVRRA